MARRRRAMRALASVWLGLKAPSGICEHLQLKDRFKKSLSISDEVGLLVGDRVVSHERSRPADHDDTALGRDTRGLILRIIVVAFLAALFWHTVITAGML